MKELERIQVCKATFLWNPLDVVSEPKGLIENGWRGLHFDHPWKSLQSRMAGRQEGRQSTTTTTAAAAAAASSSSQQQQRQQQQHHEQHHKRHHGQHGKYAQHWDAGKEQAQTLKNDKPQKQATTRHEGKKSQQNN